MVLIFCFIVLGLLILCFLTLWAFVHFYNKKQISEYEKHKNQMYLRGLDRVEIPESIFRARLDSTPMELPKKGSEK